MNREQYEKYYQKGGTYVIPVEIFNDLIGEKEHLIEYLENMLDGTIKDEFIVTGVKYLLNKVRSGKYE